MRTECHPKYERMQERSGHTPFGDTPMTTKTHPAIYPSSQYAVCRPHPPLFTPQTSPARSRLNFQFAICHFGYLDPTQIGSVNSAAPKPHMCLLDIAFPWPLRGCFSFRT
jgi:hypothetical protein